MGLANLKYAIGVFTVLISILIMLNTGYTLYKAGLLTHSLLFTYALVISYETVILLFKREKTCKEA